MLPSTLTIDGCNDRAAAATPTRSMDSFGFVPMLDEPLHLRRPPQSRPLIRFGRHSSSICWASAGSPLPLFVCMAMRLDDSWGRSSAKTKSNFIGSLLLTSLASCKPKHPAFDIRSAPRS